jgi:hypothetical protein
MKPTFVSIGSAALRSPVAWAFQAWWLSGSLEPRVSDETASMHAVYTIGPDRTIVTLVRTPRLRWPDGFSFGPGRLALLDGELAASRDLHEPGARPRERAVPDFPLQAGRGGRSRPVLPPRKRDSDPALPGFRVA